MNGIGTILNKLEGTFGVWRNMNLGQQLVSTALEWQRRFGVAPAITSALLEYDAAILVGCPEEDYCSYMQDKTAVSRGAVGDNRWEMYLNRINEETGLGLSKERNCEIINVKIDDHNVCSLVVCTFMSKLFSTWNRLFSHEIGSLIRRSSG